MKTGFFNRPTQAVINALTAGKSHVTEAEVITITGLKPRLVEQNLAEAMELGALCRRRVGNELVFMLPASQVSTISRAPAAPAVDTRTIAEHTRAQAHAPARAPLEPLANRIAADAPATTAAMTTLTKTKPPASPKRGGAIKPLPAIDLSKLRTTHEPLAVVILGTRGESKWDPLFNALAREPIEADAVPPVYPTKALDPIYGKAVQAALRKWQAKHKNVRLRVSAGAAQCKVQRVA